MNVVVTQQRSTQRLSSSLGGHVRKFRLESIENEQAERLLASAPEAPSGLLVMCKIAVVGVLSSALLYAVTCVLSS